MKLRIVKKHTSNGEYYVVEKKTFLGTWKNVWNEYYYIDCCCSYPRIFKTLKEAEKAIDGLRNARKKDVVVKELEI